MHLRRPWIAFVFFALGSCAVYAAVVYKWTDGDGVIHFSDQAVPGAEKIVTSGPTSRGIGGGTGARPLKEPDRNSARGLAFTEFSIDSPQPEENFTGDVVVNVHLKLAPGLRENQSITWHLNGQALTDKAPDSTGFALSSLARGSYVLSATIIDQDSGESVKSEPVNFYVRQPSTFMPHHKTP